MYTSKVVECNTLFIDHCVSFMKIYCLWGHFINCVTQFMILPNNQLLNSAIQRYLYRWYNPFSHIEAKIELYQINIYIFSFNAALIQHDTGKNKLFNGSNRFSIKPAKISMPSKRRLRNKNTLSGMIVSTCSWFLPCNGSACPSDQRVFIRSALSLKCCDSIKQF